VYSLIDAHALFLSYTPMSTPTLSITWRIHRLKSFFSLLIPEVLRSLEASTFAGMHHLPLPGQSWNDRAGTLRNKRKKPRVACTASEPLAALAAACLTEPV
jgi:hypothetical protein